MIGSQKLCGGMKRPVTDDNDVSKKPIKKIIAKKCIFWHWQKDSNPPK